MVLEEVLSLSSGADAPAPAVNERVRAMERDVSRGTGRRGGCGGGSWEPRQRSGTESFRRTPRHGISPCRAGEWTIRFAAPCQRSGNSKTNFLGVPAKAPAEGSSIARARVLAQFRLFEQWGGRWRQPYLSGYEGSACTDTYNDDGGTSRFGVDAGSHRRRSGETWGRSISAACGLQGAHAESADEFDALLDDVQSAGLSGVDRQNGASLIKDRKADKHRFSPCSSLHSSTSRLFSRVLHVRRGVLLFCEQVLQLAFDLLLQVIFHVRPVYTAATLKVCRRVLTGRSTSSSSTCTCQSSSTTSLHRWASFLPHDHLSHVVYLISNNSSA